MRLGRRPAGKKRGWFKRKPKQPVEEAKEPRGPHGPPIYVLGDKVLGPQARMRVNNALRKSKGRMHVIVEPENLADDIRILNDHKDKVATLFVPLGNSAIQKTYDREELLTGFANFYAPEVHRRLKDDAPSIVLTKDVEGMKDMIKRGWMPSMSGFPEHVTGGEKGLLQDLNPKIQGPIILVPTKEGFVEPKHGYGPLKDTLGHILHSKKLDFAGGGAITDPKDGSLMFGMKHIADWFGKGAEDMHIESADTKDRSACFPDMTLVQPKRIALHGGRFKDLDSAAPMLWIHPEGEENGALERFGEEMGFTPEKLKRNEPCPCGSGKKVKKCHGEFL